MTTTASPAPTAARIQQACGCSRLNTVMPGNGAAKQAAEPNGTASQTTTNGKAGGSGDRTTGLVSMRCVPARCPRRDPPRTAVARRHSSHRMANREINPIVARQPQPHRQADSRRDSSRRQTTQLHHGRPGRSRNLRRLFTATLTAIESRKMGRLNLVGEYEGACPSFSHPNNRASLLISSCR